MDKGAGHETCPPWVRIDVGPPGGHQHSSPPQGPASHSGQQGFPPEGHQRHHCGQRIPPRKPYDETPIREFGQHCRMSRPHGDFVQEEPTPPSATMASRKWSVPDFPVPPVVIVTSGGKPSGTRPSAAIHSSYESPILRWPPGSPPNCVITASSCGPNASRTCPGAGSPEVTTSEPVSTTATLGLRCT